MSEERESDKFENVDEEKYEELDKLDDFSIESVEISSIDGLEDMDTIEANKEKAKQAELAGFEEQERLAEARRREEQEKDRKIAELRSEVQDLLNQYATEKEEGRKSQILEQALRKRLKVIKMLWEEKRSKELLEVVQYFYSAGKRGEIFSSQQGYQLSEELIRLTILNVNAKLHELTEYDNIAALLCVMPVWDNKAKSELYTTYPHLLDLVEEIFDSLVMERPLLSLLQYKNQNPLLYTLEILTFKYKENLDSLFEKINQLITKVESQSREEKNMLFLTINSAFSSYYYMSKNEKAREYADLILQKVSTVTLEEEELVDSLIELNSLTSLGFKEGDIMFDLFPPAILVKLDDRDITKKELQFFFYPLKSRTKTMEISKDTFKNITKKLDLPTKGFFDINERKTPMPEYMNKGIVVLVSKTSSGDIDGLMFIESAERVSSEVSEGETAELKVKESINSLHFYGIADTEGDLGSGETRLYEYIQKLIDGTEFEQTKIYLYNIPGYELTDYYVL